MRKKKIKLLDRVMRALVTMQDNFRAYRQIKAIVEPTTLDLYRELLPEPFDMPEQPLVLFIVVDNSDVAPWPMTPYQEGIISLRCSYQDQDGWYALTMPVNRWVAMASGRMIGFPKYLAEEITLAPSGSGWRGEVLHDGCQRLLLEFADAGAQKGVTWQEKAFPMFNLTPPGRGPDVKKAEWVEGRPSQSTGKKGMVRITIAPSEPWSGLVAPGTVAQGWYETFKGGAHVAVGE